MLLQANDGSLTFTGSIQLPSVAEIDVTGFATCSSAETWVDGGGRGAPTLRILLFVKSIYGLKLGFGIGRKKTPVNQCPGRTVNQLNFEFYCTDSSIFETANFKQMRTGLAADV